MTEELWRDVPGWEGHYQVSRLGAVKSEDRSYVDSLGRFVSLKGQVLKPVVDGNGYGRVTLRRVGEHTMQRVHRLVLLAFVGPCPDGEEACHYDGDRLHNSLENLRWATPVENQADRKRHGNHYSSSKTECPAGHSYDERNTYVCPTGRRHCRECGRNAVNASYARKRARLAAAKQATTEGTP